MQTSEFLHLLGHFSGSPGSWDVFRGRWHHAAIPRILLLRGVLSRAGLVMVFCAFFLLLLRFSVPAEPAILNRTFRKFHRNVVIFVRRLLDVTSSPGRSLSSSTKKSGCSRLGCHHPVMLLQHSTSGT